MNRILHAEIEVDGCDVQFAVNDIPVWEVLHRRTTFHAVPVHEFLVQGANTLRLLRLDSPVTAPPAPQGQPSPPPATARLRIAAYPDGAALGQGGGQQLALLEYRSHDAAGNPMRVAETVFDLPQWPFTWAWQALPAPGWGSPQAQRRVFDWLQEFAARFQRADLGWLAPVLQPKMADYCRAYGQDLAVEMRELEARLKRRAADAAFRMTPFTADQLALQGCAGGRLVDCVLTTGQPAIRWSDSRAGPLGAMRLKLGLANQQLLVFR